MGARAPGPEPVTPTTVGVPETPTKITMVPNGVPDPDDSHYIIVGDEIGARYAQNTTYNLAFRLDASGNISINHVGVNIKEFMTYDGRAQSGGTAGQLRHRYFCGWGASLLYLL